MLNVTPEVGSRYGAPMGRHSVQPESVVELERIALDSGGYDDGGAYWGLGEPLFAFHDGESVSYMRAASMADARSKLEADGYRVESNDVGAMVSAYVEAILFTENRPQVYRDDWSDEEGEGTIPDGLDESDFDPEALEAIRKTCSAFLDANRAHIETAGAGIEQVGHDLWLTRNGHGAGFWDRHNGNDSAIKAAFDALDKAARKLGEVDSYWGDDGRVHV